MSNPLLSLIGVGGNEDEEEVQETEEEKVEQFLDHLENLTNLKFREEKKLEDASYWETLFDSTSGNSYYWNKNTNETTWTKPEELKFASATITPVIKTKKRKLQDIIDEKKKNDEEKNLEPKKKKRKESLADFGKIFEELQVKIGLLLQEQEIISQKYKNFVPLKAMKEMKLNLTNLITIKTEIQLRENDFKQTALSDFYLRKQVKQLKKTITTYEAIKGIPEEWLRVFDSEEGLYSYQNKITQEKLTDYSKVPQPNVSVLGKKTTSTKTAPSYFDTQKKLANTAEVKQEKEETTSLFSTTNGFKTDNETNDQNTETDTQESLPKRIYSAEAGPIQTETQINEVSQLQAQIENEKEEQRLQAIKDKVEQMREREKVTKVVPLNSGSQIKSSPAAIFAAPSTIKSEQEDWEQGEVAVSNESTLNETPMEKKKKRAGEKLPSRGSLKRNSKMGSMIAKWQQVKKKQK